MSEKIKAVKMVFPAGTANWPKINKPDFRFKEEGEYSVKVVYTEEEAMPILQQLEALREEFRPLIKANDKRVHKDSELPLRKQVDKEGEETGMWELKMSQKAQITTKDGNVIKFKPIVFDAKKKIVNVEVGGGSLIKGIGEIVPYNTAMAGFGLSIRLKGVQVLELVRFDGEAQLAEMLDEEEGYEGLESEPEDPEEDLKSDVEPSDEESHTTVARDF